MRILSFFFLSLLVFTGCAVRPTDPNALWITTEETRAMNKIAINKLSLGISKAETLRIMGTKTHYSRPRKFERTIIPNPYKVTSFKNKDGIYTILYYYTDVKKHDGAVTDDELTPIVLLNDKVIGWGQNILPSNVKKYQLDIR